MVVRFYFTVCFDKNPFSPQFEKCHEGDPIKIDFFTQERPATVPQLLSYPLFGFINYNEISQKYDKLLFYSLVRDPCHTHGEERIKQLQKCATGYLVIQATDTDSWIADNKLWVYYFR